jgi:hypothetical protein
MPGRLLFLAALALMTMALPASAQEVSPPDAATVAAQIGQPVEFQDEVKAVSFSKSTNGYYLSFGAPYPKQTLSVWVDAKIYDHLPVHHSMVGRTVRISGQVEKSSTGPLIKLDSREHFTIQNADEAILSKPALDGRQERAQFKTAVFQVFKREDFDTLEILGQELQQSHERLLDGSWLSEAFFNTFRLPVTRNTERYANTERILADWEQAKPGSNILPLIQAGYHLDLAWQWRGNGYANTVTREGWDGFKKELAAARKILDSYQLGKKYPEYFALMQTVALGEGWSKERYDRLFDEAARAEPDYSTYYCHKAYFLLPRWNGRKGEWEEFAEQVRRQRGAGGAGDALYARIAISMREFYNDLFHESAVSWDKVASGYEYLIRQNPGSNYLRSFYANLAWKMGDRARLQKALPAIGPDPDMTVWVNLENVALAEKFAAGPGR